MKSIVSRCFVALLLLIPSSLMAQPLADRVPEDAIVYFGWSGTAALPEAYQQSHLKAILDSTKIRELFTQMLPLVMEKMAVEDASAREPLSIIKAMGTHVWTRPVAIYSTGLDTTNPRRPMPKLTVICQAGDAAQAINAQLQRLVAQAPRDSQVRSAIVGDLVVLSVGYADPATALAQGNASLGRSAGFTAAMKQVAVQPVISGYVDGEKVLGLIESSIATSNNPQAQAMAPKVIDALGIRGLKRFAYSAGFDGKDWMSAAFVDAPAPRTGLLAAVEAAPVSAEVIKAIPADATFAASVRFDPAKAITAIRTAAGQVDPQAQRGVDMALGAIQLAIARNPVTDVLEPLGRDWAIYCSPSVNGNGVLGMVIVNKLDDPAKAQSALPTAWINLSNWVAVTLSRQQSPVQIVGRTIETDGMRVFYLGSPVLAPAWSIKEGYLYMGLYPQTATSGARAMARANGKSLVDNERFQALQQRLGVANPTSFSFFDLPTTAAHGSSYQQLLAIVRYGGFGDLFGVPLPEPLVPPLDVLQAHLGPAGGMTWVDDAGFHMKSISPFPGAKVFSEPGLVSGTIPATGGLMASILLPSLNRARETANRVKCAANLRSIGQAMLLFANENRGRYPANLGELIKTQDITVEVFVCPSGNVTIPPEVIAGGPDAMATWVNDNGAYVYLGAGKTNSAPQDMILVHERPDSHDSDGMNVLFGDGHVEFLQMEEAIERIQNQTRPAP